MFAMLFLVVIVFISLFQGTIGPPFSNLDRNGQNVCTRQGTKVRDHYVTISTIKYSTYYTSCGAWGWGRCKRTRSRTVYRSVKTTRTAYVTIIDCCSGWQQYSYWSTDCRKDVNECASNNGGCDQVCNNTPGSYQCSCISGYTKNGPKCTDVNECASNNGGCDQVCTNSPGSYQCSCNSGYTKNGPKCTDVNECASNNGGCDQVCTNTQGSYRCSCYTGYIKNGPKCTDIN